MTHCLSIFYNSENLVKMQFQDIIKVDSSQLGLHGDLKRSNYLIPVPFDTLLYVISDMRGCV